MRYIIGIDLGTTNSAVSYVDTESENLNVQTFRILQVTDVGLVDSLATLPSFCYLAVPNEFPSGSMTLPWSQNNDLIVGSFAKKHGAKIPTRLVQSAKSWLCHAAANRRDPILPVFESVEIRKLSPVDATTAYLKTIKEAWNFKMAKGKVELEFENQEIILTVPASFDEVARSLTVEAAKKAGFMNMTLLEEPQSAFYSYIAKHQEDLKSKFKEKDIILVVDIGGGTTDFSLIEVQESKDELEFQRMAVGDHLLLGGDNMDATIAYKMEEKLPAISSLQRLQLLQEARNAKEYLLSSDEQSYKFTLQGKGSSVVLGSIAVEIKKQEIEDLLMNGFFLSCTFDETKTLKKASGIKLFGLSFEDEPSIIKQLGFFLHQAGKLSPDFVLFNGGACKPKIFSQAVVDALESFFPEKKMTVLESESLDLAVSKGASYYGKAKRGLGIKISGGAPRGYYLGVETKDDKAKAICTLPRGSSDDSSYESDKTFFVTANTAVSFQLYTSHVRLHDKPGELIDVVAEEMHKLPEIRTVLAFGKKQMSDLSEKKIPVHLKVMLTAIGTLEIYLLSQISDHQWKLEFQLKSASSQDNVIGLLQKKEMDETFDSDYLNDVKNTLSEAFSKNGNVKLESLMETMETNLGKSKKDFSPSVLRALFDLILTKAEGRFLSEKHFSRFYNLAGFFLRPGLGYPLDDFRVKNLWKLILSDIKVNKNLDHTIQKLICYRRISAGLSKGQQNQIVAELLPELKNGKIEIKAKSENYLYSERIRAFGSFELLPIATKIKVGQAILERIQKASALDADYFALARIGSRHLAYGTVANLIPLNTLVQWIEKLLEIKTIPEDKLFFLFSLMGRKSDLAEFNIPVNLIDKILSRFENTPHFNALKTKLTTFAKFSELEEAEIFGESLPVGLSLEG